MDEEGSGRSSRRALILIGVLASLAIAGLGLFSYIKAVERRRWDDMRAECEAIARKIDARDPVRPVLRGAPEPGNAWDDYTLAESAAKNKSGHHAGDYLFDRPGADKGKAEAEVALFASAIQALRNGTRKGTARRPTEWEKANPRLLISGYLVTAATCQARLLSEAGRSREAQELALDLSQYGLDVARSGGGTEMAGGTNAVGFSLDELRRQLLSSRRAREELLEISHELGVLDGNFPRPGDWELVQAMETGFEFLATGDLRSHLERIGKSEYRIPTWKYAFSDRLLMADAFREMLSAMRRMGEAEGRPWPEAWPARVEIERDLERSRNPLYSMFPVPAGFKTIPPPDYARECRAHLRLLRVASRWLAMGEIEDLEDPFGTALRHRQEGTRLQVWSVGPDGVDDQGTGEWSPKKGKDIVLEVSR